MAGTKISEATLRDSLKGTENIPITDTDLPKGRTTVADLSEHISKNTVYYFDADKYFKAADVGFGSGDGFVPQKIRDEILAAITNKIPIVVHANSCDHLIEYTEALGDGEVSITLMYHEIYSDSGGIEEDEFAFTGSTIHEVSIEISTYLDIQIFYNYETPAFLVDENGEYPNYFLEASGRYKKIDLLAGTSIKLHGVADTTFTMASNPPTYHVWDEVPELNLTFTTASNKLAEYMFEFQSGETPTVLTVPDTVKWIGSHDIQPNMTYQVSIVNNIGIMVGIPNTTEETA